MFRTHQLDLKDDLVIDHPCVDHLPQNDASFADAFREALFHQLLLLLSVVGEGPLARERVSRKKSLDVDLIIVVRSCRCAVDEGLVLLLLLLLAQHQELPVASFVLLVQKLVSRVRVQEGLELGLGPLSLPVSLGEMGKGCFRLSQNPDQVGQREDVVARCAAAVGTVLLPGTGFHRVDAAVVAAAAAAAFHAHRCQLGGDRHSRPGIPGGVGDLVIGERKPRPIALAVFFLFRQVDTEDRLAEALESRFVLNRCRSLGHDLEVRRRSGVTLVGSAATRCLVGDISIVRTVIGAGVGFVIC